jgi:hypothetical protein
MVLPQSARDPADDQSQRGADPLGIGDRGLDVRHN